jgi:hypothetical protein
MAGDAVPRLTEIAPVDPEPEVPEAAGPFGLSAEPYTLGPGISDRKAWEEIGKQEAIQVYLKIAEEDLKEPVKPFDEEGYRAVMATGDRTQYDSESKLQSFLAFVIAELVINDGRYVQRIQDELRSFLDYPTWVYPSHAMAGGTWDDTHERIDLASSALGHTLVLSVNLLGDRIDPKLAQSVRETAKKRVVDPYLKSIRAVKPGANWWIKRESNWNAVCHEGVVGAALGLSLETEVKEEIVSSALKNLKLHYFDSFTPDGYLGEGLGYWNYGFGQYLVLAEVLRGASNGRIEIMSWPEARRAAEFPFRYRMADNLYPTYGDCYPLNNKPDAGALQLLAATLPAEQAAEPEPMVTPNARHALGWRLQNVMALASYYADPKNTPASGKAGIDTGSSTWFPKAQVFVGRAKEPGGLSLALKGGWNEGSHSQNDVGSFIVGAGGKMVLADPGMNVYTPDNFDHRRFEHAVNNSFGHSVPVVDGILQGTGGEFGAKVLEFESTEEKTRIVLDLAGAYPVEGLTKLTREVVFRSKGPILVIDHFEANRPISFESGLVTFGRVEEVPGGLKFVDGESSLHVGVEASLPWAMTLHPIKGRVDSTRAGLVLGELSMQGSVQLVISQNPLASKLPQSTQPSTQPNLQ